MSKVDVTKEKWVALSGSVFTERTFRHKPDLGREYYARQSVAFNVGDKVAKHMVEVHNEAVALRLFDPRSAFEEDAADFGLDFETDCHGEYADEQTQAMYRVFAMGYCRECEIAS